VRLLLRCRNSLCLLAVMTMPALLFYTTTTTTSVSLPHLSGWGVDMQRFSFFLFFFISISDTTSLYS
jgi:hypothetical protein